MLMSTTRSMQIVFSLNKFICLLSILLLYFESLVKSVTALNFLI